MVLLPSPFHRRVDLSQGVGMHVRGANRLSHPDVEGSVGIADKVRFRFEPGAEETVVPPVDEAHDLFDGVCPDNPLLSELFHQLALILSLALPGSSHDVLLIILVCCGNYYQDTASQQEEDRCDIPEEDTAVISEQRKFRPT